jgi:hypothetical protein
MPQPDEMCPDGVYHIMRQCWQENPDDRPSFTDLKLSLVKLANHDVSYLGAGNPLSPDYQPDQGADYAVGDAYAEPRSGGAWQETPAGALKRTASGRDLDSLKEFRAVTVTQEDYALATGPAPVDDTGEDYEMPEDNRGGVAKMATYDQGALRAAGGLIPDTGLVGMTPVAGHVGTPGRAGMAQDVRARTASDAAAVYSMGADADGAEDMYSMADAPEAGAKSPPARPVTAWGHPDEPSGGVYSMGDGEAEADATYSMGDALPGEGGEAKGDADDLYSMADSGR